MVPDNKEYVSGHFIGTDSDLQFTLLWIHDYLVEISMVGSICF